jgi:hypothetical protein
MNCINLHRVHSMHSMHLAPCATVRGALNASTPFRVDAFDAPAPGEGCIDQREGRT